MSGQPFVPSSRVRAIVVTHDRRELLRECLEALHAQTRRPDSVLVVDNASADGTSEMLAREFPNVDVLRLEQNRGGAAGFHAGLKRGLTGKEDWFWLMDDDTIAKPDALQELLMPLDSLDRLPEPALLASKVVWTDGSLHHMNEPWPRLDLKDVAIEACGHRLVSTRAQSFVSVLVRREDVLAVGLPRADFFLWGDDIEFTARLLRDRIGFLVPQSVVVHKTVTNYRAPQSVGSRYYYDVRNKVVMLRGEAWGGVEKVWFAYLMLQGIVEYLLFNRLRPSALQVVSRGLRDGLRMPA